MAGRKEKDLHGDKGKPLSSTASLFSAGRSLTTECGNDVSQLETLFHDMMLCSLCGEVFRDPTRLPKALPCTHTYCAVCLVKCLQDRVLECPECGNQYDVQGDVDVLPNSAMIMRVLNRVCKFCHTMAKLEECSHCKRVSCAACLRVHLEEIREELCATVREISRSTEKMSSKQNLVDGALLEVNDRAQNVKSEVASEADRLIELISHRRERVIDQIEREVAKERKRLTNIKKALADTQETNLSLCAGLAEELEQPLQTLAGRLSSMRNTCAVQLDKIKRENAAVLSLGWELTFDRPSHEYIKRELEHLKVVTRSKSAKSSTSTGLASAARGRVPSPARMLATDAVNVARNTSLPEHNLSLGKLSPLSRGRSESSL